LSVPEAAVATGLSISTIRRLITSGKLPARFERGSKGQNRYFIARADLATLAELGKAAHLDLKTPRTLAPNEVPGAHGVQGDRAVQPRGEGAPSTLVSTLEDQPRPRDGALGLQENRPHGDQEPLGDQPVSGAGAHSAPATELHGDHGSLEEYATQLELGVLRERLAGAQEAVRLHAERVRGQAKDIGFLQSQLDQSRKAEEQLRVLLARLTTALPSPDEPKALEARNVTPAPRRSRWMFWRR